MQPTGIEPVSRALQTPAMTTSAKVALKFLGVTVENRTQTTGITILGTNRYTTVTPKKFSGGTTETRTPNPDYSKRLISNQLQYHYGIVPFVLVYTQLAGPIAILHIYYAYVCLCVYSVGIFLVAPARFELTWTNYLLLTGYKSAVLPLNYRGIC